MKTKKMLALVLTLVIAFSLMTVAAEAAGEEPLVIQIGYDDPIGDHIDLAVNRWAELLEEASDGTMTMECYPANQLGTKTELIDQILAGAPVITLADGAFYADRGVPDFGIAFGPYMFDTWDNVWQFIDSDVYADLVDRLAESGLRILCSNWIYGDRNLLTKEPINSLADLKGMKIRVPSNNIQIQGMAVLGANPTPMSLGDVYTALQQGTIDGFEQPTAVIYAGKYYEAAKYLTVSEHVRNNTTWITGTDFFNSLTEEQQQWLTETGEEAGLYCNEQYEEQTAAAAEAMKAEGVEINEIDLTEFKEAAKAFYELDEFTSVWSENWYETVSEAAGQ